MRLVKIAVLILLLAWYGAFLFHKIDFTTSDLGRHIKNEELILAGPKFLAERLKDPAWKQIYLDNYVIIFEKSKP